MRRKRKSNTENEDEERDIEERSLKEDGNPHAYIMLFTKNDELDFIMHTLFSAVCCSICR